MRKHRWIAPVWGMVATAAFGQASAQAPPSPLDGPFPPAGPPAGPMVGPPGVPYAGNPTYTPIAPDAASPAGFPPGGMRPWPTVSPFDNALDQSYNQDGIWFRKLLNHERKYKFEVDFLYGRFRQPGGAVIGHDIVRGRNDTSLEYEPDNIPADFPFPQRFIGVKQFVGRESRGRYFDAIPSVALTSIFGLPPRLAVADIVTLGPGGEGETDGFPIDLTYPDLVTGLAPAVNINGDLAIDEGELSNTNLYVVTGGVLADGATTLLGGDEDVVHEKRENPEALGLKGTLGLEDEDKSGVDITGWWMRDSGQTFSRGTDDPQRLRANGIILFDAGQLATETIPRDIVEVLDYNQLFKLENKTDAAGTDIAFYHTPVVDYDWVVVRPLYGARYNYIGEQFGFTGRDSGQFVVFDQYGRPLSVSDTEFANDDPVETYELFPYETKIVSEVTSHLYGPQVGLDLQMGGEHFMVNSALKTGIVANTEQLSIAGHGFGLTEAITGQRVFFGQEKTHTRVAPFVEFSADADINVFPIIPYVNRWHLFKNARVNLGWTGLVVGNIQRPIDQIAWRSESIGGPHIQERGRDAWYVQNWNVGLHWNF